MTQEEYLKEILRLKNKNPDMEIHFCLNSDEITEHQWAAHKIYKIEILPWYVVGEEIFVNEGEIMDHLLDECYEETLSEEENEKHADERYATKVKNAICVFTFASI